MTISEPVVDITSIESDKLSQQIESLDLAAKRALFAERVPKPTFFDNAFNYVELPLDELLVRAGKQPSEAPSSAAGAAGAVQAAVQSVASVAPAPVVSAVKGIARQTRESTPAASTTGPAAGAHKAADEEDDDGEDDEEAKTGQQKKGWFGGFFGRK